MWCLPTHIADEFLQKIASGDITPDKMIDMSSAQRREFFSKFMGEENAKQANALLETKLILKNQQQGMVTWAEQIAGITPEAKRGLINRVNKMSEHLTPETEDAFLEDLAAHVMGTTVTMEEMGNIASFAKDVDDKKLAMEEGPRRKENGPPTKNEMEYGRAVVAFNNYVGAVEKTSSHLTLSEHAKYYIHNPIQFLRDAVYGVAQTSREMRTTFDNSFIGKQGRNLFFKGITGDFESGRIWVRTFNKSWKMIWDTFGGRPVMDELNAEIWSDPDYDLMRKAEVAIATVEEEMPADWLNTIPFFGRILEAPHNAYTGSAHYMRYKVAKQYFATARKTGVDLRSKEELVGIGHLVNSLTGRGYIGTRSETPSLMDNIFFSRRMLKADFDVLTAHLLDRKITSFARKEAAKNLLRIIIGNAIILAIAKLIKPDCIELDPRSADFGKIKIGNTRFDITAGVGSLLRLSVQLVPLLVYKGASYKSTTTGKVKQLNTGKYGERTGLDVFEDYLENKVSPAMSIVFAHLNGYYRYTDIKVSPLGDLRELFLPLSIDNMIELGNDDKSAGILIGTIFDALGVFTNTYSSKKKGRKLEDIE